MKIKIEMEFTFVDADFGTPVEPPLPIGIVMDAVRTVAGEVKKQIASRYAGTGIEIEITKIEEVRKPE